MNVFAQAFRETKETRMGMLCFTTELRMEFSYLNLLVEINLHLVLFQTRNFIA